MSNLILNFANILVVLLLSQSGQSYLQEVSLHRNVDQEGTMFKFSEQVVDTMTCFGGTKLLCVRGFWIGYEEPYYEGIPVVLHGTNSDEICFETIYKSIRHGGYVDTEVSALSIYPYPFYAGQETVITSSATSLRGQSLTVSGRSDWLLFDGPDFTGNSACLTNASSPYPELGVFGIDDLGAGLGLSNVGSAVLGC